MKNTTRLDTCYYVSKNRLKIFIFPTEYNIVKNTIRFLELDTCYYVKNFTTENNTVQVLTILYSTILTSSMANIYFFYLLIYES